MKIDLHNHTTYSDGVWSVEELLKNAQKQNVDVLALTDHDSVFGCLEFIELAKKYNINAIAGMELSTFHKGENVHIICLFKKNKIPSAIEDFAKKVYETRKTRALKMLQNIKNIYNLKIDADALLKSGTMITRGNMLRNVMICNNMTIKEAEFYISNDSKAYIPSSKLSTIDGLKLIKENNGIAILAHPCLMKYEIVKEVLEFGFDGIEIRYPKNKIGDEEKFSKLAKDYGLFISAGSDCHGDKTHAMVGTSTLNDYEYEVIKKKLEKEL